MAQGFLFSRALPFEHVAAVLQPRRMHDVLPRPDVDGNAAIIQSETQSEPESERTLLPLNQPAH
jgi:hypothetical protein